MVKYLAGSGKCSRESIKGVLFNENGTLKKKFNYLDEELLITNNHLDKKVLTNIITPKTSEELSEKYQAQQEWNIKKYILMSNLYKFYDGKGISIHKDVVKIVNKLFENYLTRNDGFLKTTFILYVDVYSYLKLVEAIFGAEKTQQKNIAIEGEKTETEKEKDKKTKKKAIVLKKDACKNSNEEKVKDYKDEDDENDQDDTPGGQEAENTAKNDEQHINSKEKIY